MSFLSRTSHKHKLTQYILSFVLLTSTASLAVADNYTTNWNIVNIPSNQAVPLQQTIDKIIAHTKGQIGIGVYNLATNQAIYYNGDKRFPMASTYKVAIAVKILQLVQEGKLSLDQMITINSSDLVPGGSGVISEQLYYPGVSVSVLNLLQLMMRLSDNTATDKLLTLAGGPKAVTNMLRELNIKNMEVDRPTLLLMGDAFGMRNKLDALLATKKHNWNDIEKLLDESSVSPADAKAAQKNYETSVLDTTTPVSMIELLKLIATNKALQPKYTQLLENIMLETQTGPDRLKGLMPPDVRVAHKTGTVLDTFNDVGYLIPASGNKIIIAVFVNANRAGRTNSEQAIANIAYTAYKFFNKDSKPSVALMNKLITNQLNYLSQESIYQHAIWSVTVKNIKNNTIVYQNNSNLLFAPASVTKTVSTAAALQALGADYQFKTPVYATGKITNNILNGDLILVGSGDFIFGGRNIQENNLEYPENDHTYSNDIPGITLVKGNPFAGLNELAQKIHAAGVNVINGNILIDNSLFETTNKRGIELSPIMLNDNIIDIVINPTQTNNNASIDWQPKVSGYTIIDHVKTVANGSDNIFITSNKEGTEITVNGTVTANSGEVIKNFPIKNSSAFARQAFIDALNKANIKVNINSTKVNITPDAYTKDTPIAEYISPPFANYVKLILKVSHNTGADMLPLIIAAHNHQKTFNDGMQDIGNFLLHDVKLNASEFSFLDGSGSNGNFVTPLAIIKILAYARTLPQNDFNAFIDGMPILGVDGSLEAMGTDLPSKGNVFAKTGTEWVENLANPNSFLFSSKSLAGFIKLKDNSMLEFMIVVNNATLNSLAEMKKTVEDQVNLANIIYENSN